MVDGLKKVIKSVSETGSPVELRFENCRVSSESGEPVEVEGAISLSPAEEDERDEGGELKFLRGGASLHCSEKETCVLELDGEDLVMDVKKGSLFRDLLKSVGGGGDGLSMVKEMDLSLHVKYKGMTLLRNADPESLKTFFKKL